MASLKHILTSAECLLKDVEILRSRYTATAWDDLSQHIQRETQYIENCNLFALLGYDSERTAKTANAPLIRIKEKNIHEKAFKFGYKYNIGDFMQYRTLQNIQCPITLSLYTIQLIIIINLPLFSNIRTLSNGGFLPRHQTNLHAGK